MRLLLLSFLSVVISSTAIAGDEKSNALGVFTDDESHLQWQDDYSDNKGVIKDLDWEGAIEYCGSLLLNDEKWRLPTLLELRELVRKGKYAQFKVVKSTRNPDMVNNYWTSKVRENNEEYAWRVSFLYQNVYYFKKSLATNVRCVRSIK